MTFLNLQDDCLERLNFDNTQASSTPRTRIKRFLNEWHRRILSMPALSQLRDDTITFSSVASTARYGLPQAVSRIKAISERTSYNHLSLMTLASLREIDPGLSASGNPAHYVVIGRQQVATQPSAATGLWAVSTSASDTNTVYIETVRTGGYRRSASVTMTGTTRVAIDSANTDHIEVDKFYVSAAAAGAISLYDASSGGNELARIPIGATFARYLGIQLWPTPASAITYYVDYTREIPDLANDTDEPLLPPDFHYLLSMGARINEYEQQDDNRAVRLRGDLEAGISHLREYVVNQDDLIVVPGVGARLRSSLGGWYPTGS